MKRKIIIIIMGIVSKFIGKSFFKIFGWKLVGELPNVPKYICVLAPHTSIWDMVWGKMYNWATGMKTKIMVKKEFFFFPMGPLLKLWNAVPIDRKYPGGIVQQMADNFKNNDEYVLTITPEGTRSPNPDWKTGFYRIAEAAGVPVYVAFSDFKSKSAGFFCEFKITGDMKKDIEVIKEYYRGMEGLYKGKFKI